MKIPIQNIYFLLCYAWNKLEESKIVNVSADNTKDLLDLFAKVLISGTSYLFKKGLDRGYVTIEEDARCIRGKVLINHSLQRLLFQQARAYCRHDELDHNVLHNKILKATIKRLLFVEELDKALKDELHLIFNRFPIVDQIELSDGIFHKVKLHRNNYFYDFLMNVCRIIHDTVLIDEQTGKYKFIDFIRDEGRMSLLFEEFIRNFYKKEQGRYDVRREDISWHTQEKGPHDIYLPTMRTDISLVSKDRTRKIVIETKYYSGGAFSTSHYGSQKKLISENLYQIYSYLKNQESMGEASKKCEGILLYASVNEDVDLSFCLLEHPLKVKSLNLNQSWKLITRDLHEIIE